MYVWYHRKYVRITVNYCDFSKTTLYNFCKITYVRSSWFWDTHRNTNHRHGVHAREINLVAQWKKKRCWTLFTSFPSFITFFTLLLVLSSSLHPSLLTHYFTTLSLSLSRAFLCVHTHTLSVYVLFKHFWLKLCELNN